MREIEFRWKDSTGQWIYGNLRVLLNHPVVFVPKVLEYTGIVLKETVGQWTGLFDIDGNRLYEGDVVEMKGHIATFITGVLVYSNPQGCYIVYREDGNSMFVVEAMRFKLLGNIFDDTDLHERFGQMWRLKNP